MTTTPPFRAEQVGSLLRPPELRDARARAKSGALSPAELKEVEDRAIRAVIRRSFRRRCCASMRLAVRKKDRPLHPKAPGQKSRGVLPYAGLAVAQHDHDDVAPGPGAARDEAMSGRLRVTGLHAVAVGQSL